MSAPTPAVFLSYASQDAEAATRIAAALRHAGVEVWFDQNELVGGDAWDQKIRRQIQSCTLFVPIISAHTDARPEGYFRLEWKLAVDRSHLMSDDHPFLFPVVIDDTPDVTARVPDRFRERQWMRLNGRDTPETLATRVRAMLNAGRVPTPPANQPKPLPAEPAPETRRQKRRRKPAKYIGMAIGLTLFAFFVLRPIWRSQLRSLESTSDTTLAEPAASPVIPSNENPLVTRARTILGGNALSPEEIETANQLLEQAIEHDPTDAVAWAQAARADGMVVHPYGYDQSEQRRQRAMQRATRALNLAPADFDTQVIHHTIMGHVADNPAITREAEAWFREQIARFPENNGLKVQLAENLREQERYAEAAEQFIQIENWELAAWSWYQGNDDPRAHEAVSRAVRSAPTTTAINLKMIIEEYWYQDLPAAAATAAILRPSELLQEIPAVILTQLAFMQRDPETMLRVLNGLSRDMLDSNAFRGPRQYYTGWAYRMSGLPERAAIEWRKTVSLLQEARTETPDNWSLLLLEAEVQGLLGETTAAEQLLSLERRMNGREPGAIDLPISHVLLALGRTEEVLVWLDSELRFAARRSVNLHAAARFEPRWDALRGDPRFERLLRETAPPDATPFAPPPPPAKSIAVLPFANRSASADDAYFVDGIHDDLLTALSRIRDLKTISRTSVMTYRDLPKRLKQIGEELSVATILQGGVQRAGNQVRINVQLTDAATDANLWAETFTRALNAENIFAIQTEIVSAITTALRAVLSPEEQQQINKLPTQNLAALEAYFKGKEVLEVRTVGNLKQARGHFEEAVRLDPDFADAHAWLAGTLLLLADVALLEFAPQHALAEPHVRRALKLNPQLSHGHFASAILHNQREEYHEADAAYRQALALNPGNSIAAINYSFFLGFVHGSAAEGRAVLQRCLAYDPLSPDARSLEVVGLMQSGQLAQARAAAEALVETNPQGPRFLSLLANIQGNFLGQLDEAIISRRQALALDPESPNIARSLASSYMNLDLPEVAAFWLERVRAVATREGPIRRLELALSENTEDTPQAIEFARQAIAAGDRDLVYPLWVLLKEDLRQGTPELSLARYRAAYPEFFEADPVVNGQNIWLAKDVAWVLMATGEEAHARSLIQTALATATAAIPDTERVLAVALMHAVVRDETATIAVVENYFAQGGMPSRIRKQTEFDWLWDTPQFTALMAAKEAEIARQRERILAMEAAGELAPIPPLPEAAE